MIQLGQRIASNYEYLIEINPKLMLLKDINLDKMNGTADI